MKTELHLSLGLSLFLALGNAQEDVLPLSSVHATQGNVAKRQSLDDAEMQAAVQAARQDKALKAAMATYSQPRPVITTPEQFLVANPPRVPKAGSGVDAPSGVSANRNEEVPVFEPVSGGAGSLTPPQSVVPVAVTPPAKLGFFDRLKAKRQLTGPESDKEALRVATGASDRKTSKKNPFAGWFKPAGGASEPAPILTAEPGPMTANPGSQPGAPLGSDARLQEPPLPPVAPSPDSNPPVAPIFVLRQPVAVSGESATLKRSSEANVDSVLVSIREGTRVGVLRERGGTATIQLPDQRVGTIKASDLTR